MNKNLTLLLIIALIFTIGCSKEEPTKQPLNTFDSNGKPIEPVKPDNGKPIVENPDKKPISNNEIPAGRKLPSVKSISKFSDVTLIKFNESSKTYKIGKTFTFDGKKYKILKTDRKKKLVKIIDLETKEEFIVSTKKKTKIEPKKVTK